MAGMTKQELIGILRFAGMQLTAERLDEFGLDAEEVAEKLRAVAVELVKQRDEARKEVEQLQGQLANCAVAARGYARGLNDCKEGDCGWSYSFEDVKSLYAEKERLRHEVGYISNREGFEARGKEIDRLKAELDVAAKENGRLRWDKASDIEWSVKARDSFGRIEAATGVIPIAGDTWISRADRIIEAIEKLKNRADLDAANYKNAVKNRDHWYDLLINMESRIIDAQIALSRKSAKPAEAIS